MKTALVTIALILLLGMNFIHLCQGGDLQKRVRAAPTTQPHAAELAQLREYLDTVHQYSDIARDSSRSGTAAVLYTHELFRGDPDAAIAYYTKALDEVHDPAVERALRFELVELYTHGPHPNRAKAMEQLHLLMTATPAGTPAPSPSISTAH